MTRTRNRQTRTGDRALGHRIRKYRERTGLSQFIAAQRVGRSEGWMVKVENGQADPSHGDLRSLATLFKVGLGDLVLDERSSNASATRHSGDTPAHDPGMMDRGDGVLLADPWLDELKRRRFLQAGLTMTGGVVLGFWPGLETADERAELAALRRVLLHYGPETISGVPDLAQVRQAVWATWADRQQSRYSAVMRDAPSVLAQVRAAAQELGGDDRATSLRLLAQTYRLVFDLLRKIGDHGLATIAADRGMVAAQEHGHPAVIASATGCLRAVLSAGRHHARAIEMATSAATNLERVAIRGGDPEDLSTYGNILLAGAEAAAQAGDRALSDDFYRDATGVAQLLGRDANHSFTAFGPTNITVHRVHAAIVLGDGERAIRLAKEVDLARLPVLERRAHHLLDVAIAYGLAEKPESALATLVQAEQTASEEVRLDPGARALVDELGRRSRKHGSQLKTLTERLRSSSS